jgi:hypothetical protein
LGYAIQLSVFRKREKIPTYAVVGFEQMLRRRQINGRPGGRSLRLPSVVADLPLLVGEALRRVADLLRPVGEALRWPFERAGWAIERRILWPLRERFAGSSLGGHRGGGAALASIAAVAVLAGVLLLPRGEGTSEPDPTPARVAASTPAATPAPTDRSGGPVLKGAPPSFGVAEGVDVAHTGAGGAGAELNAGSTGKVAAASGDASSPEEAAAATTSSQKPAPAGPAAMKVARRFSQAFVFYEIGARRARSKTVFGETATPELATALGERPPRLPAGTKVPKARVVNLVPGPRAGKAYTVSVSLLRLGLTSELRLELSKVDGEWLVTDVRG